VSYTVAKMSFGRRVELTRRIRELAARREFVEAGDTPNEKMEAALLASEIDRIYLLWGLKEVTGLELDGRRQLRSHWPRAGLKSCSGRLWQRSSNSAGCRKPKEKTDCRTPFSILQPSRLGVRGLP
jgi:hypothetical protein